MRKMTMVAMLLVLTAVNGAIIARPPSNVVVTSTIADADGTQSFSLQSDFIGSYVNGTDSVVSQIQGIGDWELGMLNSPNRRVNVTFDDFAGGSTLGAPPSGWHPVRFLTQCTGYGFNLLNLTTVGQTARCGMVVAVKTTAGDFSLRFYAANATASGSNDISVQCTAVGADNKCSGWRTQSPNGTGKLIAKVLKVETVRGKQVLTNYGLYRFSFDMSFARP